jgi:hypothetical protein
MVIVSLLLLLLPLVTPSKLYRRHCGGAIRHVHLAVGADPSTSMTVSFASIDSDSAESVRGAVLVGTSRDHFDHLVLEDDDPMHYTSMQPKHYKGEIYASPYQHHVTITGLHPRTTYYYMCVTRSTTEELLDLQKNLASLQQDPEAIAKQMNIDERNANVDEEDTGRRNLKSRILMEQSLLRRRLAPPPYDSTQCACPDPEKVRSFRTIARAGHGYQKLAVIGDIGQFPHSEETWDHMRTHHKDIDSIILAGDLAYPELDHNRWDTFMDFLDDYPLVENVPMHITPGNHDIGKPENGTQIFAAYEARFRMPRIQPADLGVYNGLGKMNMDRPPYPLDYDYGNAYYAFQHGRTHQIFINSYSAMEPGSKQYEWLVDELERVNRRTTPWLLVTYHVPIYNTFEVHQHDEQMFMMREHIEPLLVHYRVNIVFNGHIHAYQRTKPVAFGKITKTGPIHVVMGAGGRNAEAEFLHDEPEEWVAVRDATIYGYGLLVICNKTHARWDWVHSGQNGDHNVVFNENVTLPPGGVDHTYFENQYFMKE